MKKFLLSMSLLAFVLAAGCSGDKGVAESEVKAAAGEALAATHDCDGSCGMKAVPVDKLTKKDGKFYCAGCTKHAEEEDHSGHDHN
jgi:hypothetical protein